VVDDRKNGNWQQMEECVQWIEKYIGCEVYFIHHEHPENGFVEFRNGGHIIYIFGDQNQMDFRLFLDILAHEAGHVLYNQRQFAKGLTYEEIIHRTKAKLQCFDQLLAQKIITSDEYSRLYAAIEEEWESNYEKENILSKMKDFLNDL
jgi:hypothetical protein